MTTLLHPCRRSCASGALYLTRGRDARNYCVALICALCFSLSIGTFLIPVFTAGSAFFSKPILENTAAHPSPGTLQTGSPITPFFLPPGTPGAARFGALFAQSVFQALCSAVLACAVGFGAAFFFVKRSLRARALFPALCAIPLAIPPLTMALAFLLSFGKNGLCTRTLGTLWGVSTPRTFLYSASGVVIAHAWYNFPLALAIIARAWNTISADAEDAARLLGARAYRVFYTITLPALAGALRSSFLVIFLYCFFSLMMVLLLGGTTFTTLEVELYRSIRTQAAHPYASTLALSQTFYALLMIWGVSTEESQQAQSCVARTRPLPTQSIQGNIERIGFFALLCGILFFLILPLFSLVLHSITRHRAGRTVSFTLTAWHTLFSAPSFWHALRSTIWIGFWSFCVTVGSVLCYGYMVLMRHVSRWKTRLPFLPLAVSPMVLAFGWSLMPRCASRILLVCAQSALAFPFAWLSLYSTLMRIPTPVIFTGQMLSRNRLDFFLRTICPLCKKGIVSAGVYAFALSAADAAFPLVLEIPDFQSVALLLYRLSSTYRFAESSALALVLSLASSVLLIGVHRCKEYSYG